jgi:ribosomal protein S18 acetylase RimI-like enzyme
VSKLSVAPIADADVPAVIALWQRCGLTRPWNDPAGDIAFARRGPNATILVGRSDGAIVASGMVGHDGHRGWVYYLAVREDARRCGHGAAMMRACETWLARRGVPKVNVMVRADNAATRGFYAALGYGADEVVVLSRRLR